MNMSRSPTLTTTSYAILGLLAVQPWSTYELTQQMDRSLGRIWPRAQSKLYEEPKKLVDHGLAEATTELVGRRPRTVYAITPQGRDALATWLQEPGAGPVLEFEQLLKIFFAEAGTRADALATLAAAHEWARERNETNLAAARAYGAGEGPFQHRVAHTLLVGAFLTEFYAMVARWADWAGEQVEQWPDDPGGATADPAALAEVARRAQW
jgi:PadR family transcriptional regulator AphA